MKILLVDDSKSARYALRLQLQRHGIEVETADSAESAFEVLKGDLPDAILMDHMMPGLNGFEALEVIREDPRTAHLPVVMCTSHEEPDFAAAARRNGVVGILPKSTAPEKLPAILAQLREAIAASQVVAVPAKPTQVRVVPSPVPAAEPPGLTEARVMHLIDARQERLLESAIGERIDQRIEARISKMLAPLLDDLRRDLSERLSAEARRLSDEGAAHTRGLIDSLAAETRLLVDAGISEARDAQKAARKAEDPGAFESAAKRIVNDTLPSMVKVEIEAERGQIMDLVEQYLREFGPKAQAHSTAVSEDKDSQAALEAALLAKAADIARRESREAVEPALDQMKRASDTATTRGQPDLSRVYLAIAGAAALGVIAAGVVFALLS